MTMYTDSGIRLQAGNLCFEFLNSGDIYQIRSGSMMINQLLSNEIDGSLNNLYLRLHRPDGIRSFPLLGVHSASRMRKHRNHIVWEGCAEDVGYKVIFSLSSRDVWFWDVEIEGSGVAADLIYGQDVGIADIGAVRSNEAYLSQYIDHTVYHDEMKGYAVCSRQNMPQEGAFPYLQQGSLTGAAAFSTDGFQFFGLSYKKTDQPEALLRDSLPNEVYQYEFAYTALQSGRVSLNGKASFVFYGLYRADHPAAVTALEFTDVLAQAREEVSASLTLAAALPADMSQATASSGAALAEGAPLSALPLSEEEINALFPERREEEREEDELLSFFTDTYEHVVLPAKELRVERPHGHILMGGHLGSREEIVTTTSYMYGVFNSQLVVGNTNFNKMITHARNSLNAQKTSGQRIYVELDGIYRLLSLPSLFEIGFNYVRWYYKLEEDTLVITNSTNTDSPDVQLHVSSASGRAYRFLVTQQISMHVNEYELAFRMEQFADCLTFRADQGALSAEVYPDLQYSMQVQGAAFEAGDERVLNSSAVPGGASLVVLKLDSVPEWTLTVQAMLYGKRTAAVQTQNWETAREKYRRYLGSLMNGFKLRQNGRETEHLFRFNALAWWYTHNMLVHYTVPHGLEQYGGAAWGTRDVCQGPVEYFLSTQHFDEVRRILLTVFSHQYEDTGNWPQWFMFDNYAKIQQEESHGDIIVWPLKVLGDYLTATRDYSILEENVPYTDRHTFEFTQERAPVLEHALKEIQYIREHFLHDTHLSAYGDGDWDDTLQPANAQLKQYMASSWTVALTYQAVSRFAAVLDASPSAGAAAALYDMAEGIRRDFERYMLGSDVIPGFVYLEDPDQPKLMLHPSDTETGISYRLLPMTRSMISELLTEEQALAHEALIREQLLCPDGVRLMNRPAFYAGGVSTHFKRAEQAANFGREIGLQYVHAHIRYVEAMAKLGRAQEAWHGLSVINPVGIRHTVAHAELRQSNAYFSSSDGKFRTRYEAQDRFAELKDGSVPVKGGWRIYSSGPGIYMNQLIAGCLGIRQHEGDLVIDPVLPAELDGLEFRFAYAGTPVTFFYRLHGGERLVVLNGSPLEWTPEGNRYREGGMRIARLQFEKGSLAEGNRIEIIL
ncbi:GH36-type glycosyl hydrolase domain-containing protein [Paenibacillus terreus]|uniref:GH36-type glycosyl hydrolase domain-containing protein n=1 Tax=Paenibacillus terreus TaxID=1387834 RepID=A0ABV5BAT6_9BACL